VKKTLVNRVLLKFLCVAFLSLCIAAGIAAERDADGRDPDFQGVLLSVTRISIPGQRNPVFLDVGNIKVYLTDDPQLQAGGLEPGNVAFSRADGRLVLWDPKFGGGKRSVMAVWTAPDGNPLTARFEGSEMAIRPAGPDSAPRPKTFWDTKNIGWVIIGFSSPVPIPAPVNP
jgi:hypothetical protein